MKRTILSIIIMLLTVVGASAQNIAEGEVGTCQWYITSDSCLVIAPKDGAVSGDLPEEGFCSYSFHGSIMSISPKSHPWDKSMVKAVEVKNGVSATSCAGLFYQHSNIETIDLSGLNTENLYSMAFMFGDCKKLSKIDFGNINTQKVNDMACVFNSCYRLMSLDLSAFDTQKVTCMYRMFSNCSSLTSLDLSNFNTQNVTNMGYMFYECGDLESLDLSSFNTQNVTNMGYMFYECGDLESLDLSSFNTQNVTNMGCMFYECGRLSSLGVNNFNTQNVTDMYQMFYRCSSLTSLTLSSFNTQKVTDMRGMFWGCPSLIFLDVSSFNTQNVTSMDYMFDGCKSLMSLDLSNFDTQNVKSMNSMFSECSSLMFLDISNFNMKSVSEWEMNEMFAGCSSLSKIISKNETPTLLKSGIFSDLSNCTLAVPVGTKELYSAAEGWNELEKIDEEASLDISEIIIIQGEVGTCVWYITARCELVIAPADGVSGDLPENGWDNGYVDRTYYTPWIGYSSKVFSAKIMPGVNAKSCSHMFSYLTNLKRIDLSNFDTRNVTSMRCMFYNCSSLTSLDLSNLNTENVVGNVYRGGMESMFSSCSSLTTLNLSNFNMQDVGNVQSMFYGCTNLSTIISNNETPSPMKFNTFIGSFGNRTNCTLKVPNGSESLYAAADGWKELGYINGYITSELNGGILVHGEVGTCIWDVTYDGELIIAPADGVSGDLPKGGWNTYDNTTPWTECKNIISSAKIERGVNATSCAYIFDGLSKVKSIDLSGLNTENVTDMSSMFSGCYELASLDLSNFNTQNVTDMSFMFSYCDSLTSLDLSNFHTNKVRYMSYMFSNSHSLKSLNLSSFNTQNVSSMSSMFKGCSSLNAIIRNRMNPSTLKTGTFTSIPNRTECTLFVPEGTKALYATADGWNELGNIIDNLAIDNVDLPVHIVEGETGTCIWYITDEDELVIAPANGVSGDLPEEGWGYNTSPWYEYKDMILSAKIEDGVSATSCRYMFSGLRKMKSLDLSGLNTQNVTDMSSMFEFCSSLTSLDLSNFNTQNVTSMSWMFSYCNKLSSLDLSNFDMQNVSYMSSIFNRCDSLKLIISKLDTPSILKAGAFESFANRDSCTLIVPAGTKALYAAADGWNELGNIEEKDFPTDAPGTGIKYPRIWTFNVKPSEAAITQSIDDGYNYWATTTLTGRYSYKTPCDNTELMINDTDKLPCTRGLYFTMDTANDINIGGNIQFGNSAPVLTIPSCNAGDVIKIETRDLSTASAGEITLTNATYNGESKIQGGGSYSLTVTEDGDVTITNKSVSYSMITVRPADLLAFGYNNEFSPCGTCIWYITSDSTLVIAPADGVSGTLPKYAYRGYAPWSSSSYSGMITSAKVLEGVTPTSGDYLFYSLSNMKSVDLSGLNTENVTSMCNMFGSCSRLESVNLTGLNTQILTSMGNMFNGCTKLTTVNFGNIDTQNLTALGGLFYNCSSLTDFSGLDTRNVTDMGAMFSNCTSIGNWDFNSLDTHNVTNMLGMFSGCYLDSLDISSFDTQNVEDMSEMFAYNRFKTLDLSNFDTRNVKSMKKMFYYCNSLQTLNISSFDTQNVTDMNSMFNGCSVLTSLDLSSFDTQSVTDMASMFDGCYALTSLDMSNFNTQNVTNMTRMFYSCSRLESLDVSRFKTPNVTGMGWMFNGCSDLTSLDLSGFDTQNVTNMRGMFYGCFSLTSLDLSNFNTQNLLFTTDMFRDCYKLKSIDLTNFNMEHVYGTEGNLFRNCDSLTVIISNNETPSTLHAGTFNTFTNRVNCTLLVPAGSKALYAEADGWKELGNIEEMEDPAKALFGTLWASVSEDENIGVHDLELLQLAYPENKAGKEGYENYEMGNLNWDAVATLIDSEGTKIEEAYAHEVDSIGAVEFSSKLKRGEVYTVNVPKGLYLIYNIEDFTSVESPAETLTYTTDYLLGDVNGDKEHSVTDIVGLASYILKGSDEVGMLVVDINGDEEATVTDISMLVDKVMTGMFPWEAEMARPRSFTTPIQAPRLFLDNKDNALALSFDNSNEFCSMQFDVALTDADGNDITSAKSIKVKVGDGTQGHSVTTGIVDGKLRVLVYSLGNKSFKAGDVVSISVDGHDTYTASITNTELTTTSFAAVRPEGVEANVSIANGVNEISSSANAQVYDLTGRKLNATTKQGVIIVGGKKVSGCRIGK